MGTIIDVIRASMCVIGDVIAERGASIQSDAVIAVIGSIDADGGASIAVWCYC